MIVLDYTKNASATGALESSSDVSGACSGSGITYCTTPLFTTTHSQDLTIYCGTVNSNSLFWNPGQIGHQFGVIRGLAASSINPGTTGDLACEDATHVTAEKNIVGFINSSTTATPPSVRVGASFY
jgi:hypothetical protein